MSAPQYCPDTCVPTVYPAESFNPLNDAKILHKAMKGLGTDEVALIEVLGRRSMVQRQEIAKTFYYLYGVDLISELKSELSDKFEYTMIALVTWLPEFYAKELHDARTNSDEKTIVEILCTLSNNEIKAVSSAYKELYGIRLEKDLVGDTSNPFKRLCASFCMAKRNESRGEDVQPLKYEAQTLINAGQYGFFKNILNVALFCRSYEQLRHIFAEYEAKAGHDIEDAIKRDFPESAKNGLLAIVKCMKNKARFFAERLHDSMKGLGTDDKTLIRIIVSRSEIDLGDIKVAFEEMYGQSLKSWIVDDTSGDYRRILLTLVA